MIRPMDEKKQKQHFLSSEVTQVVPVKFASDVSVKVKVNKVSRVGVVVVFVARDISQ